MKSRLNVCIVLRRFFNQKHHLNRYIRPHIETPFECLCCSKMSSQNQHLNCHIRVHTKEKPFECF